MDHAQGIGLVVRIAHLIDAPGIGIQVKELARHAEGAPRRHTISPPLHFSLPPIQ
jgi:hypothetical protein